MLARVEDSDPKKRTSFILKYGDEVITWTAESAIEANDWIKCIKDVQTKAKSSKDTQKEIMEYGERERESGVLTGGPAKKK
jgi:hypothetical protein